MALIEDVQRHMTDDSLPEEVSKYLREMVKNAHQCAVKYAVSDSMDKRDGLYFLAQTESERFICKKSDEWKMSPLGFVIFWGRERTDIDVEMSHKIWSMDAGLIKTFDTFKQVLIYYSMKSSLTDNNWINLVVMNDPYGPSGWAEHPLHARAVALSPKYYEVVHLYRGVLRNGLDDDDDNDDDDDDNEDDETANDSMRYILLKKTYIDYRTPDSVKRFYFNFPENENNS